MGITGNQIKHIRKTMKLNAEEFATLVGLRGVHRARTVYKWECESASPSGTTEKSIREMALKHDIGFNILPIGKGEVDEKAGR